MIHYKHFAIPNVWLVNGYEQSESAYGPVTSYEDVEGLERTLRSLVLTQRSILTGKQIRFLRTGLALSQAELANNLSVDTQTVARWEKEETAITPMIDSHVRVFVMRTVLPNLRVAEIPTAQPGGRSQEQFVLEHRDGVWRRVDPAVRMPQYKVSDRPVMADILTIRAGKVAEVLLIYPESPSWARQAKGARELQVFHRSRYRAKEGQTTDRNIDSFPEAVSG